ncbi:DNA/RNA polymerases superfamily protein [Gossypium australe]|uniref:DNA/RNA polymerases superfamily protein n=1 Tax=Gossypium australe TaxID=47621 RepID=A0A5B6UWH0_9ROSI|nr:DNA/RNA polymerases superfamily protein [Gossypium australe]
MARNSKVLDHSKGIKSKAMKMDYELVINYHPRKANVVADALSRKSLFALRAMNTWLALSDDGSILAELRARPIFLQEICEAQKGDSDLQAKRVQCELSMESDFRISSSGCLMFRDKVCVPRDDELIRKILHEAYCGCLSVHPGSSNMYNDLKKWYWWLRMKKDISEFVSKCLICQQVKAEHQAPSGLLQPLMVLEWKWVRIYMDFLTGLPLTLKNKDVVWVVVDRLMKLAHFIPVRIDYSLLQLADLYVSEIRRLQGVPLSIISNRDLRFTSWFWKNTAFHPQSDGQSERVIQILEDMLRCCVLELQVEFSYNNSFQSSLKMAPYEALYGGKCRMPLYWTELRENQIHEVNLVRETKEKVKVFLKVSPWKKVLRFGRKGKLSPRFVGPYEITERIGPVAYRLALPSELEKIHDVFHVYMFHRYRSDPLHVIVSTEVEIQPDMTYGEESAKILAREVKRIVAKTQGRRGYMGN